MPFGDPKVNPENARKLELIYSQWLKPTVESIKIDNLPNENIICHRADKEVRPGEIITHIIENLITADIVIADLSGKNSNVFYELGVRHSVNNNTILIADSLDDIPFDLRGLRTIIYQYEPERMLSLRNSLEQAIKEIFSESDKIDNPVRKYLYDQEIDRLLKQKTPPGYDVIKDIISEMSSLKKEFQYHIKQFKHIAEQITLPRRKNNINNYKSNHDLKYFEGIWKDQLSSSTICAHIVNGKLLIPYCWAGSSQLTGHFYGYQFIRDTLFMRFKWFNSTISGFAFLRVESKNKLIGGWWSDEELTSDIFIDILRLDESVHNLNKFILKRDKEIKRFPLWAEKYFKNEEKKKK
jgi:hypothetical protein